MTKRNPVKEAAEAEIKKIEATEGKFPDDRPEDLPPTAADFADADDSVPSEREITLDLATATESVSEVLDVAPSVAAASDVLDAFIKWADSDEDGDLAAFQEAGLLDRKQSLTSAGMAVLDDAKIGWRTMYFIKIGVPLTLTDRTKLLEGSSLLILNGGTTKDGSPYWMVFAGEKLPKLEVYAHRLHQFWNANYPLKQKMGAKYTKVG